MAGPFDLIAEAKKLVRFDTVTWSSNAECAVYIGSLFRRLGMEFSYQESRENGTLFMNVAGIKGSGKKPLLLATHLDTVAPGDRKLWTRSGGDPWKLTARGDALIGLGAADTKLDFLCKLTALAKIKPKQWKRPVILLGTYGEESGMRGAARFCQGDLPQPAMALVGEPTDLEIVNRHKGFIVLELSFKSKGLFRPSEEGWVYETSFQGEASHSSTPDLGQNALDRSRVFLQELSKRFGKVTVLEWEGGTAHNVIPASARLRFSLGERPKASFKTTRSQKVAARRLSAGWYSTLPWSEALWCVETLASVLESHRKTRDQEFHPAGLTWNLTRMMEENGSWNLVFDVRPLPGQAIQRSMKSFEQQLWKRLGAPGADWQFRLERDNPALDLEPKSLLVKEAKAALRTAKIPFRLHAKSGCSEAGLYSRVGIPSVVFGPGRSMGNIHRPNESVSLRQVKAAVRFYEAFLERVCC